MGVSNLFKVLADPLRREILVLLREGRLSAGEISTRLSVAPTALSYHLKLLKQADLVLEYRQRNYIYYEINTSVLSELLLWLKQFGGKES
ncbi:MAG: winged helix-turn-helix transcriptional regulator [Oscillospiraceae bacterium]|nr:winged helix-turn-helix transcriptional regulator [Oscillospiraceae bacterium]